MRVSLKFRDRIAAISQYLLNELDQLAASIRTGWLVEHNEDGTHKTRTMSDTVTIRQEFDLSAAVAWNDIALNATTYEVIVTTVNVGGCEMSGFTGGTNGQTIVVVNQTAVNIDVKHDTASVAAHRIYAWGNADAGIGAGKRAMFVYDGTYARWIQMTLG